MPKITRIKQQKNENRANVYLDGRFAFGVTIAELLKNGLNVGIELDNGQIEKIKKTDQKEKVYGNVVRFAMMRPRSEKEIRQWFKRKETDKDTEEEVFNRLKRLDLVDDGKFAAWWVEQRTTFRQKSKRVIGMELKFKGITDEIIEEVLEPMNADQEEELARKIVEKKLRTLGNLSQEKKREKLINSLARRGFSWDIIKKAV